MQGVFRIRIVQPPAHAHKLDPGQLDRLVEIAKSGERVEGNLVLGIADLGHPAAELFKHLAGGHRGDATIIQNRKQVRGPACVLEELSAFFRVVLQGAGGALWVEFRRHRRDNAREYDAQVGIHGAIAFFPVEGITNGAAQCLVHFVAFRVRVVADFRIPHVEIRMHEAALDHVGHVIPGRVIRLEHDIRLLFCQYFIREFLGNAGKLDLIILGERIPARQ